MKFLITLPLIILLCLTTALAACGGEETPPEEKIPEDAQNSYSPCLITEDMVGNIVRAAGEVAFVDNTAEDGLYIDLEADGCRVGVWVEWDKLSGWSVAEEEYFIIGAIILVEGKLTLVPFPARPSDKHLVIELELPPRLLGWAPPSDEGIDEDYTLQPLDMPAYPFDMGDLWRNVIISGVITYVDDTKAAGLYAEMEIDGCKTRLWVERQRWATWNSADQANFAVGKFVTVNGILTLVLNELVVNLSVPPVPE